MPLDFGRDTCTSKLQASQQYGRSALAQRLLGPWATAPKSARTEFAHFLQLVSKILGGEASSQEVEVSFPGMHVSFASCMKLLFACAQTTRDDVSTVLYVASHVEALNAVADILSMW